MAMITIRQLPNDALGELANKVLEGEGIFSQVVGQYLGITEVYALACGTIEVMVEEEHATRADAILRDHGL